MKEDTHRTEKEQHSDSESNSPTYKQPNLLIDIKNRVLNNDATNFNQIIDLIKDYWKIIFESSPKEKAKFNHDGAFNYQNMLEKAEFSFYPASDNTLKESIKDMFKGSMKANNMSSLFNMVPAPLLDTVAINTIINTLNTNSITDGYGGNIMLYEQKIARSLGKLIGWDKAWGISCNGGKLTLLYAIRSAIAKLDPYYNINGIPKDIVFLVNAGAHYSIEHILSILGVGSQNALRVECDDNWNMNTLSFKKVYEKALSEGKRVAGIICCAGTTINFVHDNLQNIISANHEIIKKHNLQYIPYIHLDSVIGWLYFHFMNKQTITIDNPTIKKKVDTFLKQLKGVEQVDSFGVDYHKNGLCPYATSFFITKELSRLNLLTDGNNKIDENDMNFGNFRACLYTIENSRPSSGIASAWVASQIIGIKGYQEYLVTMMEISELFKNELTNNPEYFEVISNNSLGWEVVFKIHFLNSKLLWKQHILNTKQSDYYRKQSYAFWNYLNSIKNRNDIPLFSIVPQYKQYANDKSNMAFLIYPTSLELNQEHIKRIVNQIVDLCKEFNNLLENKQIEIKENYNIKKPIR